MKVLGLTLALSALLWGCGVHANKPKPSWVRGSPNLEHPDYHLVVGTCRDKSTADEARQCALHDARRQLAEVFGAQGGLVRDEYFEYRTYFDPKDKEFNPLKYHSSWILMAYPKRR